MAELTQPALRGASDAPGDTDAASVRALAVRAKDASRLVATATDDARRAALERIARAVEAHAEAALRANAADVAVAEAMVASGELSPASMQRLHLSRQKLAEMAAQVRAVAALPDPCGRVLERTLLDEGLTLERVSCPLGVIAAVIEARPDAVTQIAALALRSGNAVVLKVGREATRSARALVAAIHEALHDDASVPANAVALVEGRTAVDALLALDDLVDLVVPRGSNALVRSVQSRTRIPVLGHADGVCHVYLDAAANAEMAADIVLDAKTTYPAACNAVETVLVHADAAPRVLPPLLARLAAAGVEVRADDRARALAPESPLVPATGADWGTEYGDLILALRVVDSLADAVAHVNRHGSGHTDAIVTDDAHAAEWFLSHVDSAGVYHNASTRFADGFRYGLGAEVGISTGRLHARGPVGLEGLASYRWVLRGEGQTVGQYTGPDARPFAHRRLPL